MPWHPGSTRIEATWSTDGICTDYRHRCTGSWGAADVRLTGSGEPMGRLDGFTDVDDAAHIVTHPLLGWFLRPDGGLGRYRVWHDRLRPQVGTATEARYAVFEDLGAHRAGGDAPLRPAPARHRVRRAPAADAGLTRVGRRRRLAEAGLTAPGATIGRPIQAVVGATACAP